MKSLKCKAYQDNNYKMREVRPEWLINTRASPGIILKGIVTSEKDALSGNYRKFLCGSKKLKCQSLKWSELSD